MLSFSTISIFGPYFLRKRLRGAEGSGGLRWCGRYPVNRFCWIAFAYAAAGGVLSSCGGGGSSGGSPAGPTPTPGEQTITITAAGVSPKQLTVAPGARVLFTNADSTVHEMNSDPHPEHTDCVQINSIGAINPGQTKETGNFNTVRTCGYHDHRNPELIRLQGQIIVR
jgi:plastocyanin